MKVGYGIGLPFKYESAGQIDFLGNNISNVASLEIKNTVDNPSSLLTFTTDRPWYFRNRGSDAASTLFLENGSNKSFCISNTVGAWSIRFSAQNTDNIDPALTVKPIATTPGMDSVLIDQNNNGFSLRIDSEATDYSGIKIDMVNANECAILMNQGYLDMNSNKIVNVPDPTSNQDAATKKFTDNSISTHTAISSAHHVKYTDAEARAAINNIFGSDGKADSNIDLDSHKIINVTDPTLNQDAATKKYVDDYFAGIKYVSPNGTQFVAINPDTDSITYDPITGALKSEADGLQIVCPLNLPDEALVEGAVVYGDAAAESADWMLIRVNLETTAASVMASAKVNTADVIVSNPTIDNETYSYLFSIALIDTNDEIYSGSVAYTL